METFIGDSVDSIVKKILNDKQIEIADKWIVAFLMSMLWIRGPAMRKQIQRIEKETTKWMIETEIGVHPDKFFDKYEKKRGVTIPPELRKKLQETMDTNQFELEPTNAMHLKNFDNIIGFSNLFYHQYWTVYISNVPKKFATTRTIRRSKISKG